MGRLVGEAAKNQAHKNPSNTVFDAKRLIHTKFSDPSVQEDIKRWPFKVEAGPTGESVIVVDFQDKVQLVLTEASKGFERAAKKPAIVPCCQNALLDVPPPKKINMFKIP